jgi:hypothetical protein
VLTKDGDELKWLDLEVAAISILAGTQTTAPRALAGPAMLRCRESGGARLVVAELAVVAACSRRLVANESSDGLHSALAQGNDGATRGERVGAQVEERRGGAKR